MIQDKRFATAAVVASACLALSWAPSVAIAHEAGVDALTAAVQADNGLPKTTEYHKVTGQIEAGATFTLVTTNGSPQRILHYSNDATKLDKCRVTSAGDKLTPIDCEVGSFTGTGAHQWTIAEAEGGYTIKSNTKSDKYLNVSENAVAPGDEAQVLKIQKTGEGTFSIGREVNGAMRYLTFDASGAGSWTVGTSPYDFLLYQKVETSPTIVPNGNDKTGTTQGQPFAKGTGDSGYFRIPSLITLNDGSLLAGIDARWNTTVDAGGLDTIISRSTDGGKTWKYSFPNYFNDSTDAYNNRATAFIDPVMIQDNDGTIHLMVDLWPGGVALNSAANNHPVNSSGYVKIDGAYRLALYNTPDPDAQRRAGAERGQGYTHYIGAFADDGFAPVVNASTSKVEHYVDRDYYLFDENKEPEYCQQLGSANYVQQNVFFYNADLHVVATSYLWKISSTDGGATWSDPDMLNEQVRTGLDKNECFYGVGPGRGLVTSTGRIILPCYTFKYGQGDGNTSVIYSDDGETWHRSESIDRQTSEATVVEADGRIYLFARHGVMAVSNDNGETWENEQNLASSSLPISTGCQIDAITYSELIDGKTAILLSCPTGGSRVNGAIFVGLVQQDGSIEWAYRCDVTTGGAGYGYSCLTEKADGSIGLLYEGSNSDVVYRDFAIEDIAKGAAIGNKRTLSIPLYGTYEQTLPGPFVGYEGVDQDIVGIDVVENADGTVSVTYTGKSEGTVKFTETHSGTEYTITVSAGEIVEHKLEVGQTVEVDVTGDAIEHEPDASVATAKLMSRSYADILGETPGSLGTDSTYTGDVVALSSALHTFDSVEGGWNISGTTSDGAASHLNLSTPGFPGSSQAQTIQVKPGDTQGAFKLFSPSASRYLHFYRDGQAVFDRCGNDASGADSFELYRPLAKGEKAQDSGIAGYERVTSDDQIKDGGSYLIVARVGDVLYALNPSVDASSKYAHVIKVDPAREKAQLSVTGVAPGTTDVKVGGVVHRITVSGYLAPEFVWAQDYSSAQAVFKRSDDGDPVTVDCVVTSERTEPTATEDGKIVYTATAEFEGKTHTDVKTVVLPATGEPGDGGNPGNPGNPDDGKPGDGKPGDGKPGDGKPSDGATTGSKPGKPSAALPQTGDPVAAAGAVSLLGSALAALGFRSKKRK